MEDNPRAKQLAQFLVQPSVALSDIHREVQP